MTGGASVPGSVEWWHARYTTETPRRPRRDGLSTDKIKAAALGLLDRHGLEVFSMRTLAEELGTTHTSLYRHVASRDELLVEVVDHVLGEVQPDPTAAGWRRRAESHARAFRQVLLDHPAVVPLLTSGQLLGPNAMHSREVGVRTGLDAGLSPEHAVQAYLLLAHFVIGSALFDSSAASRTKKRRTAMTDLFAALPADRFPTVVGLAEGLNTPDADAKFDFGLGALLDGLEVRFRFELEQP